MFPSLIAFFVGILSLFADINTPKGRYYAGFLAFLLMLACGFQIKQSSDDERYSEWQRDQITQQGKQITDLSLSVQKFASATKDSLDDLDEQLKKLLSFGFTPLNATAATSEVVNRSLKAEQLRTQISESTKPDSRENITVQYFPKDVDRQIVEKSLRELGFNLISGRPNLKIPTNAIWFGSEVPIEDVKLVAFTLIRAGVEIKVIRPFRNPGGSKARLIQVGSDAQYVSSPPLSPDEIQRAENFTR